METVPIFFPEIVELLFQLKIPGMQCSKTKYLYLLIVNLVRGNFSGKMIALKLYDLVKRTFQEHFGKIWKFWFIQINSFTNPR